MFAVPLLFGLVVASLDLSDEQEIDSVTPTGDPATENSRGVRLTEKQIVIVVVSVGLTVILIVAEGVLAFLCRVRRRRRIPTELEEVMLPAPDDAYGSDQL
jgi:hypothetical protein